MSYPELPAIEAFPARKFAHPERAGSIVLFGMVHVGHEKDYRKVFDFISEFQAANSAHHYVLSEGLRGVTHEERAHMSPAAQHAVGAYHPNTSATHIAELLGLTTQHSMQARYDRSLWHNADMSMADFVTQFPQETRELTHDSLQELKEITQLSERDRRAYIGSLLRAEEDADQPGSSTAARNAHALGMLRHIKLSDPEASFVLPWGKDHFRGFTRRLINGMGYYIKDETPSARIRIIPMRRRADIDKLA